MLQPRPLASPNDLAGGDGAALCWLGQAGFVIEMAGERLVIDPYLSDSLAVKYEGKRFPHRRMMPPPIAPADLSGVDWLLCTHGHTDHMDPGTIPALLAANPQAGVVVPRAEVARAIARGVPQSRLFPVDAGETIQLGKVRLTAVPAAHETMERGEAGYLFLGYVLTGGGVTLWHAGDTIPWPGQAEWLTPFGVDVALLPINGRDELRASWGIPGNLTFAEAVFLTDAIGASAMLAHHFGLFDFNTVDPALAAQQLPALAPAADVQFAQTDTAWHIAPRSSRPPSVLMVCKGNICRSPVARAALARLCPNLQVDSAATMDWNVGKGAFDLSQEVARDHGIDISGHVARQVQQDDFDRFDLILAMDGDILAHLQALRPPWSHAHLGHLGAYITPGTVEDIVDPWGKDREAFEGVNDKIDSACAQLAKLIAAASR